MQRPSSRFRSDVYISYVRYPEKCFTQIFGDLYGNTMLVPIQMGTNVADGNQQEHLLTSFVTKACFPSRNS